jgi:hypothetical protein
MCVIILAECGLACYCSGPWEKVLSWESALQGAGLVVVELFLFRYGQGIFLVLSLGRALQPTEGALNC